MSMLRYVCLLALCGLIGLTGAVDTASAQVLKAQVLGTISDDTGAVIPGASVTLTETNTNVERVGETNESGLYVFTNLDPGVYDVSATMEGFSTALRSGIGVQPNTTVRINFALEIGAVTETVEVTGAPPVLQTDRADTGAKIQTKQLQEMPLAYNRNYQGLLTLVPGVGKAFRPHSQFYNSQDSLSTRINGQGRQFNNFQIEGIENKIDNGNLTALVPPIEAIQTVDISTSNFDPEFGQAGGAVVNVTLRSGTNELHGSAFYFHRNENVQARQVFASTKAPTTYNQFGFTLGGPIKKDKMFIFGDYQGSRDHLGQVNLRRIPSNPFRAGDFSSESDRVYDPATGNAATGEGRTPFANNQVPASRISPIANSMIGFLNPPNVAGAQSGSPNLDQNSVRIKNIDAFDVKYDWIVSDAGRLTFRYSYQEAEVIDCGLYGPNCGIYGGPRNNGFLGTGPARTQSPMISYTHIFSPTFIWEGRFGIVRNRNDAINSDQGLRTSEEIGIPGVNIDEWTSGLSEVRINGFDRPVIGFSPSLPWARSVTFFGVVNNFTKTMNNHVIRFGMDVRRERNDLLQTQTFNPRGRFMFEQGQTGTPDDTNRGIANAFASFLLDQPNQSGRDIAVQFPARRELTWNFYVQDKWQFSQKLTLDLGLRYEYERASRPRFAGGYSNYNPDNNTLELNGIGANPFANGLGASPGLGPRLGLAYRLDDKTVIRTGYGISFIPRRAAQFNFPVKQNNAFNSENSFVRSRNMTEGFPSFELAPVPDDGIIRDPDPRSNFNNARLDLKRAYVQSWNFAIQRALPGDLALEVAYVGNRGVNNQSGWNINAALAPGTGNGGRPLFQQFDRRADTNSSIGTSTWYNSMQVKLDRRFSSGFGLTTAYTWGKAINFTDDTGSLQLDGFSRETNRGRQRSDRTHIFTQSYQYELPFGPGKRFAQEGAARWVLGDWQVQGIFSAMAGEPFTITAAGSTLNAPGNSQRADVVGTPNNTGQIAGPGGTATYFTTNAFAIPAQNTLGNAGRNILSGPGLVNFDFSIFRRFPMPREGMDLTLRIESFNFTNTPHFNNPQGNVNNSNFGRVTSAQEDQRQFQFGLTLRF